MQEYAVVTLTNGVRAEWLELCVDSVRRNLPVGAVHYIVPCTSMADFARCRLESLRLAKYITFADDDDLVTGDSLRRCLEAVHEERVAVAFTDEVTINATGEILVQNPLRQGLRYIDVAMSVKTVHHTTVLQSDYVCTRIEELTRTTKCPSGIDWLIAASATLRGGAVHVPVYGSQWRHHGVNMHKSENSTFNKAALAFRTYLKTMVGEKGLIKRLPEDA